MSTGDEQTRAHRGDASEMDTSVRDSKPPVDLIDQLLRDSVRAKLFGGARERAPKLGRLAVLEAIGAGATGTVFSAFDPTLDRKVAVKILRGRDGTQTKALLEEARALSKLNHPNVVSVFDAGEIDGSVYLVMEFVTGPTLERWLTPESATTRSWQQVVGVLKAAGEGLAAAHDAGLVHCDVKPANIVVSADRPRVLDFGLAKAVEVDGAEESRRGAGTPNYMAPEVLAGGSPSALSDQFSLGVTAYEALYGIRPHCGGTRQALRESSATAAKAITPNGSTVPSSIEAAIRRTLAVEPADRFPSIGDFVAALAPKKKRWRYLVAALLVATIIGVLSYVGGAARSNSQDACDRGARNVAALERSKSFASARLALEAQSSQWAEYAFTSIATYNLSWENSYRRVCGATRTDGGQSEALLDLRMQCLSRRAGQLNALILEIATIDDRKTAARVGSAVLSLESPVHCETTMSGDLTTATDKQTLSRRQSAEHRLDRAWANYSLARYSSAKADATPDSALAIGDAPRIRAEQMLLAATIEGRTGNSQVAKAALHRALSEAATADDPRLELRIWQQLLRNDLFGGDPHDVVELVPFAEAAVARLGDPQQTVADIEGEALRKLGKLNEARAALVRASSATSGTMRSSFVALNLGALELGAGRAKLALAHFQSGLETTINMLGNDHPQTALFVDRLGDCELASGELAAALKSFNRSLAMRREIFGASDRATGSSYLRRGRAHLENRDWEAAKSDLENALSIRVASYGGEHRRTAEPIEALGDLALAQGQADAALEHYRRAHHLNPVGASAAKLIDVAVDSVQGASSARRGKVATDLELRFESALVPLETFRSHLAEPSFSELWSLLAHTRLAVFRGKTEEVRSVIELVIERWQDLESLAPSHSLVLGRILSFAKHSRARSVLESGLKNTAETKSQTGIALQEALKALNVKRPMSTDVVK